jgi:hypothetical protein
MQKLPGLTAKRPPYQFDFIDCFSNVATVAKPLAVTPYYTSTPFHYG